MSWRKNVTASLRHFEGRRIGAAVSGGADSVFLLYALRELGLAACVLHVNHRLRGLESDADESFVRDLAARLELPVYTAHEPVAAGNIEQEARRARHRFFAEGIAAGYCDLVATGHTLDDQAETVLARFLRGAGTAGLSGIHPLTDSGLIRPLLDLRRAEIREFLRERGIAWQEDCSNADTEFQRNRIRLDLMPRLAALNPALPEVLASTAQWARAEEDYWTEEIDRLEPEYLIRNRESILMETEPFRALPLALQRRLLRHAIVQVRGSLRSIDFRHVEAIRDLMHTTEGSGRIQLPDLDIYRSFDWLRLAPIGLDSRLERNFEVELAVPGPTFLADRHLMLETELTAKPDVYNNNEMNALDRERCAGALRLRNWRPGDGYRPLGKANAGKIKTLFQDFRIPLWERRGWPVVVSGDAIVWSRGFGVAEQYAAGPGSREILRIRDAGESNCTVPASIQAVSRFGLKRAAGCRHPGYAGEHGAEVS